MRPLGALALVCLFGLLLGLGVVNQRLPAWLPWLIGLASLVTAVLYAFDKRAAIRSEHRIAESTLHLAGLAGGWPGALLAQSLFRHKTVKRRFRQWFWCTVFLHCVTLAWLAWSAWLT